MEAVIFIGLQGAGKLTFHRDRFFTTRIRINLCMLRTRHREKRLSRGLQDQTGKAAQLAVAGAWKHDPLLDQELREIYRRRRRSPTEGES